MALGDLGFNAVSDAMLLTGVGDLADIGIKIGADLLEHGGIEVASHVAEDEVEHVAEDCGGLSFSSNTLVTTSVGAKAIGTLKVGQKVWSYNPKTKKMEWEPIQHVWIDHDNDLVDLTIGWTKHTKKGDVHEDETIHTNQKHPFLTVEEGFVPVSNLHVGMHLVEGTGQIAIIEDWLVIAGSQTMYNLTVQQDHTYTVGDGQFVVHNCAKAKTEVFERFGSQEEAMNAQDTNQLSFKPGTRGPDGGTKWISEPGEANWKKLGPKTHQWKMTITTQAGTTDWLNEIGNFKDNEPSYYGIPSENLDEFNSRIINISSSPVR